MDYHQKRWKHNNLGYPAIGNFLIFFIEKKKHMHKQKAVMRKYVNYKKYYDKYEKEENISSMKRK